MEEYYNDFWGKILLHVKYGHNVSFFSLLHAWGTHILLECVIFAAKEDQTLTNHKNSN